MSQCQLIEQQVDNKGWENTQNKCQNKDNVTRISEANIRQGVLRRHISMRTLLLFLIQRIAAVSDLTWLEAICVGIPYIGPEPPSAAMHRLNCDWRYNGRNHGAIRIISRHDVQQSTSCGSRPDSGSLRSTMARELGSVKLSSTSSFHKHEQMLDFFVSRIPRGQQVVIIMPARLPCFAVDHSICVRSVPQKRRFQGVQFEKLLFIPIFTV